MDRHQILAQILQHLKWIRTTIFQMLYYLSKYLLTVQYFFLNSEQWHLTEGHWKLLKVFLSMTFDNDEVVLGTQQNPDSFTNLNHQIMNLNPNIDQRKKLLNLRSGSKRDYSFIAYKLIVFPNTIFNVYLIFHLLVKPKIKSSFSLYQVIKSNKNNDKLCQHWNIFALHT